MGTVLLYAYFAVSLVLVLLGLTYLLRSIRGVPVRGGNGTPTPRWLHVFVLCLGCLGILSSAPSLFSSNPHWFVDKIYSLVSRVIEASE